MLEGVGLLSPSWRLTMGSFLQTRVFPARDGVLQYCFDASPPSHTNTLSCGCVGAFVRPPMGVDPVCTYV